MGKKSSSPIFSLHDQSQPILHPHETFDHRRRMDGSLECKQTILCAARTTQIRMSLAILEQMPMFRSAFGTDSFSISTIIQKHSDHSCSVRWFRWYSATSRSIRLWISPCFVVLRWSLPADEEIQVGRARLSSPSLWVRKKCLVGVYVLSIVTMPLIGVEICQTVHFQKPSMIIRPAIGVSTTVNCCRCHRI